MKLLVKAEYDGEDDRVLIAILNRENLKLLKDRFRAIKRISLTNIETFEEIKIRHFGGPETMFVQCTEPQEWFWDVPDRKNYAIMDIGLHHEEVEGAMVSIEISSGYIQWTAWFEGSNIEIISRSVGMGDLIKEIDSRHDLEHLL